MAARDEIKRRFGAAYVPDSPRMYKNKAKNAQEAHECIRPTEMARRPDEIAEARGRPAQALRPDLEAHHRQPDGRRADWSAPRSMWPAPMRQVGLRATGQVVLFDGFLKVYEEGRDDEDEDEGRLPQIMQGEPAEKRSDHARAAFHPAAAALYRSHAGQADGRAGHRPAFDLCLDPDHDRQDREYVRKDKNRLIPEDKGRLVTAFLTNFFRRYVEYDFTADLEDAARRRLGGRARLQGSAGAVLARFLGGRSPKPPICGSARCWTRSTSSWRRTCTRRAPTAATRASARSAAPGGCT